MSADNGIYIVEFKDGWRVAECQVIDNLYWHPTCCDNPNLRDNIDEDSPFYHDSCINCGTSDPDWEHRETPYLDMVYNYFHDSKVFKTRKSAFEEAQRLYAETLNDDFCPFVEYGIQTLKGFENINFPTKEIKENNNE